MIFKCNSRDLSNALRTAMKAVPSKTSLPVLECVLIETSDTGIYITSNDMDMGLITKLDGEVQGVGKIAIEAKMLSEIARKLPNDMVIISTNDKDIVQIKCGRSKFEISGRNAEEFVRLPETEPGITVTVNQNMFRNAILKSIFCISANDNNALMTGEKIEINGRKMRFVALDGHRIAITEIVLDNDCGQLETVVPGKTLIEISKLLKGGEMQIQFTPNHVIFTFGETKLISRIIDGKYFEIGKMLNLPHSTVIKVNADELLSCIDRASVVIESSEKKPIVIELKDGTMQVSANTQRGRTHEEVEVDLDGEDITIGLNSHFAIDAINAASFYDDEIEMRFLNQKSPVVITKDGAEYMYIVLPVQIG